MHTHRSRNSTSRGHSNNQNDKKNNFSNLQEWKLKTPKRATVKKRKIKLQLSHFQIFGKQQKYQRKQNLNPNIVTINTEQKQWKIQDFEIIKKLGRGKFGHVYAAKEKATQYLVALKKMNKNELKCNDFEEQVKREIVIQSTLKHQNILKLYGYLWDDENIYLILEYAPGGQLLNFVKKQKNLSERNVSVILRQVCRGLNYLHENNILHRDIKPENIVISCQKIKIADFGWSIYSQTRRETLCGTLDYLAPQIVKGQTHDYSIDIWQIGILAYQLAVGHPPFETQSFTTTYDKILNQQVKFPLHISLDLRQFIRFILQKNPYKRPSIIQILNQPFIRKYEKYTLQLM